MKYTRGSYHIKNWENKSTSHSNEFEAKCEAEEEKKPSKESLDDRKHACMSSYVTKTTTERNDEREKKTKPELFRQSKKRDLTRWRWNIYICCSSEKKKKSVSLLLNVMDLMNGFLSYLTLKSNSKREREKKNAKFYDRKPQKWLACENLVHIR